MSTHQSDKKISQKRIDAAIGKHRNEYEEKKKFCPWCEKYTKAYVPIKFGEKVRSRRHELDINQQKCAKECGMTGPMLSKIEDGRMVAPNQDYVYLLCVVLECTPDYLLGMIVQPDKKVSNDSPEGLINPISYWEPAEATAISEVMQRIIQNSIRKTYIDCPDTLSKLIAVLESKNPELSEHFDAVLSDLCHRYGLVPRRFDEAE